MTASIIFHEDSREFHLCNDKISYIMTILKNGELGQLYFGKSLRDRESFGHLLELQKRPMSACAFPGTRVLVWNILGRSIHYLDMEI